MVARVLIDDAALAGRKADARTHANRRLEGATRDGLLEFWELEDALVRGGLADALEARGMEVQWTCGGWHVERDGKVFETGPVAVTGNEVVAVSFETTMRLEWIPSFLTVLPELLDWLPTYRDRKIHGALAYLDCEDDARRYAERVGLFLIRVVDGRARIENGPGFKPRSFG